MKPFSYFSKNGNILRIEEAVIPLSNIEYQYGFGVYETLKVRNGVLYFVSEHVDRLFKSADIIGITHSFTKEIIPKYLEDLVQTLKFDVEKQSANIKMLLIGGREPQLFIIPLKPLFPDRKLYKQGASVMTYEYERLFPHAKSLNMLPSYLAYKKAKGEGCYDALLINSKKEILEGTRTNFFAIKGKMLFTPPLEKILEGVTLLTVEAIAKRENFEIREQAIPLSSLKEYDGVFLTSTSSKIMPLRKIDEFEFSEIPENLRKLMKAYDEFLNSSDGVFK